MKVLRLGFLRLVVITRVMLRHGMAHLLGGRPASWAWVRRRLPMAGLPGPERLRMLFEDLGGTFIKFGQMLALQPDIISLEYCNALFKLLDRVEPFPYPEAERIWTEELGRPPSEVFDEIDPEPLATASVGQVHTAWLGGRKVAVKVQRPNVGLEFGNDIRMMVAFMSVVRALRLKPLYWMLEPGGEFVSWTREELDYRYEARYAEKLRGHASDNPVQVVPRVYTEYTTRRTLVVEFLEGVSLLNYLRAREQGDEVLLRRLEDLGFDRARFAANIIDNFLGDAFRHGIYHADLHPANLFILKDSVVGYIDFGITGVMSPYSRTHLMAMTLALAQGDLDNLYGQFLKLSSYGPESDLKGFRDGLDELTSDWYEVQGTQKRLQVNFTRVMTDMLQLSRDKRVMPERDIVKYIRSAIAIDGLIIRFEADFHVGRHLESACGRHIRWRSLRSAMSYERFFSMSNSGARLLSEGAARSEELLDRLASGGLTVRTETTERTDTEGRARMRAVQLAAMVATLAALVVVTEQPAQPGWNLFTAELALFGVGIAMLVPTLWRLT